jgi:hypothetical protein
MPTPPSRSGLFRWIATLGVSLAAVCPPARCRLVRPTSHRRLTCPFAQRWPVGLRRNITGQRRCVQPTGRVRPGILGGYCNVLRLSGAALRTYHSRAAMGSTKECGYRQVKLFGSPLAKRVQLSDRRVLLVLSKSPTGKTTVVQRRALGCGRWRFCHSSGRPS